MDFNRAEPTCYRTHFPADTSFPQQNAALSYIVLHLTYIRGLILKLSQNFPNAQIQKIRIHQESEGGIENPYQGSPFGVTRLAE